MFLCWCLFQYIVRPELVAQRREHVSRAFTDQVHILDEMARSREAMARDLAQAGTLLLLLLRSKDSPSIEEWTKGVELHVQSLANGPLQVHGVGLWFEQGSVPGLEGELGFRIGEGARREQGHNPSGVERFTDFRAIGWYSSFQGKSTEKNDPLSVHWSLPYAEPGSDTTILTVGAPILYNGVRAGVATVEWSIAEVQEEFSNLRPTDTAQGFLVDPRTSKFLTVANRADLTSRDVASVAWGRFATGLIDSWDSTDLDLPTGRRWIHKATLENGLMVGLTVPEAEATASVQRIERMVLQGGVLGIVLCLMFVIPFTTYLMRPIRIMSLIAQRVSRGDFYQELPAHSGDEVGALVDAFGEMTNYIRRIEVAAVALSQGKVDRAPVPKSTEDSLSEAMCKLTEGASTLTSDVKMALDRLSVGDLTCPKWHLEYEGVWKELIDGITALTRELAEPIRHLSQVLERTMEGDTRARVEGCYSGEFGELQRRVNATLDWHHRLVQALEARTVELQGARDEAKYTSLLKGHYLENMSREVRDPLAEISRSLEELSEMPAPEEMKGSLSSVKDKARTLLESVDDIRDLSCVLEGKITFATERFELAPLLERIVHGVSPLAASKELVVHWESDDRVPAFVTGDPARLEEILKTLLLSAVASTPESGAVLLLVSGREHHGSSMTVSFSVAGSGAGMSSTSLRNIFEPRVLVEPADIADASDPSFALMLARVTAQAMGGKLTATSREGIGTVFHLSLPYEGAEMTHGHVLPSETHILVLDDQSLTDSRLQAALTGAGYSVSFVTTPHEAHTKVAKDHFDLIVIGAAVSPVLGRDMCRLIRVRDSANNATPILAFTKDDDTGSHYALLAAGADRCVESPTSEQAVVKLVAEVISSAEDHDRSVRI
jgi:signal transduction histidine kinase/CheY-like chemotaxis protein/HAMP domain-containing protein